MSAPAATAMTLPAIPDIAGKVQTVTGLIDPSEVGETLMHEHVVIDIRRPAHNRSAGWDSPQRREPLGLANLARARLGGGTADNGVIADFGLILAEINEFAHRGGGTLVDLSSLGLGRDGRLLARLSRASGLNIVMGGGWYEKNFHPADMDDRSVEDLTEIVVNDIVIGVDGTSIRTGIIGEVGVEGNPLTDNELKSARASARASRLTGCPISYHSGGFREEKLDIIGMMFDEGVAPASIVMGHSNGLAVEPELGRRVLDTGVFIEFDYLGAPGSPAGYLGPRNDYKVARGCAQLVAEGYDGQIVLGHDICTRLQLKRYGGTGYCYISDYFVPALREMGVGEESIHKIMVDNPSRALTFVAPQSLVR